MQRIVEIDYARCAKALLRKAPLILIVTLLFGIVGSIVCFYTLDRTDKYSAHASVLTRSTNEYGNAAEGVQYATLAKSLTVAQRALDILGGTNTSLSTHAIYDMITVKYDTSSAYVNSSAVIDLYAVSTKPDEAVSVVNAVAQAFVDEVTVIVRKETNVALLDRASSTALVYDAQNAFFKYVATTMAAGFLLTCALIVLLELLSFRLVSVQDGTLNNRLEIIGVIPDFTDLVPGEGQAVAEREPAVKAAGTRRGAEANRRERAGGGR